MESTDEALLRNLLSRTEYVDVAWEAFLCRFSNLILKVVWQFEQDYDEAMEKYLFVCRKLAENDFGRLRRFQISGEKSPRFTTWLAAVANNLCIDFHRSRHGRRQLPRKLLRLSAFDREIFRLYYWKGRSHEEIEARYADKSGEGHAHVSDALSRIQDLITGRSRATDKPMIIPLDENDPRLVSEEPDIEMEEVRQWLSRWLDALTDQERVIIRLRFWEDMKGPEIAEAMRISPEEKVYPLLQKALDHLREQAGETYGREKSQRASVLHRVKGQHKNAH